MPETPNPKLRQMPPPSITSTAPSPFAYVELDVKTNFSFLRGASHPDELVYRAAEMGYRAIAVTDFNSLAGAVRMHEAAKEVNLKLLVGARLTFCDAPDLLAWAPDRNAYARLCRLLTLGKRRAEKGECELRLCDFLEESDGLLAAVVMDGEEARRHGGTEARREKQGTDASSSPSCLSASVSPCLPPACLRASVPQCLPSLRLLRDSLGNRLSLAVSCAYGADDETQLRHLLKLSRTFGIPLLATNDVYYHDPGRRMLQDALTCIRHGCTIHEAGFKLFPNGERYLKTPEQMHRLFADCPQAIRRGLEIADQCDFKLDSLRYEYPDELVPAGKSPIDYLAGLTWCGATRRYPRGVPDKVCAQIEHELKLIEQLHFAPYFLTVYDLMIFARSRGILCQGRGSAANSAVCYCIGVTSVDPARIDVLFERFISAARNEPPDIDVDFEHERREEVIQYVYQKYGRDRAGMTATVITYRGRSAIRDVGKAMGLSLDIVDSMAAKLDWWDRGVLDAQRIRACGLDPADKTVRLVIHLATELLGFPRHLGQHVGGMVMTRGSLCEMVPIENATMEGRTVIEWDKDDIDALGLLKVDVLALGMLTCISKAFKLINERHGGERRHEGTEARRHEGERLNGEDHNGRDSYISGSDRLATGNGVGQSCLPNHQNHAKGGTVRTDQPDEESRGVDSLEHRGGIRATEHGRLSQIPSDRQGVAGRTGNTVRVVDRVGNADPRGVPFGSACGGRPGVAGPDSEHRKEVIPSLSSPSCLRASVPPCLELHTVPPEDPNVYDMIDDADTIGVFQVESRAQMSMLPRLRPRNFYDLVIEVAIVRPGPIQGNMVHPYLKRRNGQEPVTYPSEELRQVLEKTLGVPLFQEQAMRISMVAAGFSAEEADKLRRAMAAWRRSGVIEQFHKKIVEGMVGNGYTREFAEQCFLQIKGFGEYGFPESHAASFALLVYVSAWLKRYHPAAFAAALLNSQPMGFYQPAQIVRNAREHGVQVHPPDVNESEWDCTLELPIADCRLPICLSPNRQSAIGNRQSTWGSAGPALRLGLRQIKSMPKAHADRIVEARGACGRFTSVADFHCRTGLPVVVLRTLAEADAFSSLGLSRRQALWEVLRMKDPLMEEARRQETQARRHAGTKARREKQGTDAFSPPSCLRAFVPACLPLEPPVALPIMPLHQEVMIDYSTTGLSLKQHPVALVRDELTKRNILTSDQLMRAPHGRWVKVAGLVLIRQRPGTASGIVFETLEDETGIVNLIVKPDIYDHYRPAARHAGLLQADGYVQRSGNVVHVLAKRLHDLSDLLKGYELRSRDFH